MISEELEMCMEGGRVSHSRCMGVVSLGYGGLGGVIDGGGGWYACGTKPGGLVACREMPGISRVWGDTLMTSDHTAVQVHSSGWVEPKFVGFPGKAFMRDATRRLRFVVHG